MGTAKPKAPKNEDHNTSEPPLRAAKRELSCDEHQVVIFESGGNYGRCCKRCGKQIGSWISHDELSEEEKRNAISNQKAIYESFEEEVRERAAEIEKERASDLEDLLPESDATPVDWRDAFEAVDEEPRSVRDEIKQTLYGRYLESDVWKNTRNRVYEEKGRECAAKLSVCDGRAESVHHRSYDHLGVEPMWDLTPVCNSCHNVLHRLEDGSEGGSDQEGKSDFEEGDSDSVEVTYDDLFGTPALEE
jgi:hypothetical protein